MSETFKYIQVKRYKRSIGRRCLRCGKSATVTAIRVFGQNKFKLYVRYCLEHAEQEIGVSV